MAFAPTVYGANVNKLTSVYMELAKGISRAFCPTWAEWRLVKVLGISNTGLRI